MVYPQETPNYMTLGTALAQIVEGNPDVVTIIIATIVISSYCLKAIKLLNCMSRTLETVTWVKPENPVTYSTSDHDIIIPEVLYHDFTPLIFNTSDFMMQAHAVVNAPIHIIFPALQTSIPIIMEKCIDDSSFEYYFRETHPFLSALFRRTVAGLSQEIRIWDADNSGHLKSLIGNYEDIVSNFEVTQSLVHYLHLGTNLLTMPV